MGHDVVLFSDGGGTRDGTAGCACIVEHCNERHQFVGYLGPATNNEAEIFGGLLGFAVIRALESASKVSLRWVCDSEYVLKSATQYIHGWQRNGWKTSQKDPVKNQGLWQAYLELSRGYSVAPEHVRGHTGHPENEACDTASTWAQMRAEEVLRDEGEGVNGDGWVLVDVRPHLKAFRDSIMGVTKEVSSLQDRVAKLLNPTDAGSRQLARLEAELTDLSLKFASLADSERAQTLAHGIKILLNTNSK